MMRYHHIHSIWATAFDLCARFIFFSRFKLPCRTIQFNEYVENFRLVSGEQINGKDVKINLSNNIVKRYFLIIRGNEKLIICY